MSRRKQPTPKPARYVALRGLMHAMHLKKDRTLCDELTFSDRDRGLECVAQPIGCDRCIEIIAYARNFPKRFTK